MLQVLIRHGVRVPDDMALIGFDEIEFAAAAAHTADLLLEEARATRR